MYTSFNAFINLNVIIGIGERWVLPQVNSLQLLITVYDRWD